MSLRLILLILVLHNYFYGQKDSAIYRYYDDGYLKIVATWKAKDTIQFIKYYKNGQMKDSVWLYIKNNKEIPIGTAKRYFKNGKLSSICYYKNGYDEYVYKGYYKNGQLRSFDQKPTGVLKTYNKKGEQVSEEDFNKNKPVFVSKKFKKGRHLNNSAYATRIKSTKAWIADQKNEKRLYTGTIVSLNLASDTTLLTHCQIEGFSKDSMYFSKFHYNENYGRKSDYDRLKFDSVFVVGVDQLKTLYYSKHRNRNRAFGALCASIAGVELILFPVVLLVILPIAGATLLETLVAYSIMAVPGTGFYFLGKHLYKTTVPKKFDMKEYKIQVKM